MLPIRKLVYLKNFNDFMKKISLLIVAIFTLVSCSTEPVDPALLTTLGTGGGSGNGGGTSTGDYLPTALNNTWNYKLQNTTTIKDYKINAIESINNLTYYRLNHAITSSIDNPFLSESDVICHLRKSNGDYFQRTVVNKPASGTSPGIAIAPFELIFLKDYLNVGQSFTQSINMQVTTTLNGVATTDSQPLSFTVTMLGRDLTLTVGTTTFTNVIKTKTTYDDGSYTIDWFSKNVGWIKSEDYDTASGPQVDGLNLMSYVLN
ncbi:MAG: hypothetical protein RL607_1551 [Bacteroidota bacterium]|jgi:hypothetical protein